MVSDFCIANDGREDEQKENEAEIKPVIPL